MLAYMYSANGTYTFAGAQTQPWKKFTNHFQINSSKNLHGF